MSTTYLIDGYNLLYAMGVLAARTGPGGLEKARLRLLGLLQATFGPQAHAVTVVFDAQRAPPGSTPEHDFHGLTVRFALGGLQADDVIEDLLQHAGAPKNMTVVSDDHRLQNAARRRHARPMKCGEFLDLLDRLRHSPPVGPAEPEKKSTESPAETQRWLEEFRDLDKDLEDLNFKF